MWYECLLVVSTWQISTLRCTVSTRPGCFDRELKLLRLNTCLAINKRDGILLGILHEREAEQQFARKSLVLAVIWKRSAGLNPLPRTGAGSRIVSILHRVHRLTLTKTAKSNRNKVGLCQHSCFEVFLLREHACQKLSLTHVCPYWVSVRSPARLQLRVLLAHALELIAEHVDVEPSNESDINSHTPRCVYMLHSALQLVFCRYLLSLRMTHIISISTTHC